MTALACAQNLKFNANGKFKIVQFTDVHYIFNDPRAEVAIERINEVLNAENPDLVMFTGDVIYVSIRPTTGIKPLYTTIAT
ncbi:metallophosphoesterase, partial [Phocaeicola plebeius]|uniref:metallophosphoesterase n=1 Tax=Phocaeicola plebeius TaxID=310297 RepID=UPI0026F24943